MTRYLEVFFRHKFPLLGLLALSLLVSTAVVAISPRNYQATANLWFDHSPIPNNSPQANPTTEADNATAVFHELLNIHDFDIQVGQLGPLRDYFDTTGDFPTNDPITPIIHKLEFWKPAPAGATRAALVDNGVVLTLQKHVIVTPVEPNEVSLSFEFGDPSIAAGTLNALITVFGAFANSQALANEQPKLDSLNKNFDAKDAEVRKDVEATAAYLDSHPQIRLNPLADPVYAGLVQSTGVAQQQLVDLGKQRAAEAAVVAELKQPGAHGFRILDKPTAPLSSTGLLKTVLFGFAGGLGVGLLLIAIVCFLLVSSDSTVMRASDVQGRLGVRVIGEVPLLQPSAVLITPPPKALPPPAD